MQLEIVSLMYVTTIGTDNMQHRSPRPEFYIMMFENVFTHHSWQAATVLRTILFSTFAFLQVLSFDRPMVFREYLFYLTVNFLMNQDLKAMVEAAGDRPVIIVNAKLKVC